MRNASRLIITLAAVLIGAVLTQAPELHAGPADPVAKARAVLAERAQALGLDPADLQVLNVRNGLAGQYVRFQETSGGLPIEGAQVVVGVASTW